MVTHPRDHQTGGTRSNPATLYSIVCAAACATLVAGVPASAVDLPQQLSQQIAQLKSLRAGGKVPELKEQADIAGDAIYRWAIAAMTEAPAQQVVSALQTAVPVVTNEMSLGWSERQQALYRHDAEVVISATVWGKGDKEILAIRVDQLSIDLDRKPTEQFLLSRPPVLIAKDRKGVVVGNLDPCDGPMRYRFRYHLWSVYTFHGFVAGPRGAWPDVVLSEGPRGSGGWMTPIQAHVEAGAKKEWRVVWEADQDYPGGSLQFDGQSNRLTVSYTGEGSPEKLMLKHGKSPKGWNGTRPLLPGLCAPQASSASGAP